MATPKSQRIGIWVIAIVLLFGTLGSFLVMALSVQNQSIDEDNLQVAYSAYQSDIDAQAKKLSADYFDEFSKYSTYPAAFNAAEVTGLKTNDLKVGTGSDITSTTAYNAYYIGWNPSGVVFDQSITETGLKTPIAGGNLIEGWNEGVIGMKIGGVREITMPSAKAYGETGSGENIPPNTPLKFIVMVIPKVEDVPIPKALSDYYEAQGYAQ